MESAELARLAPTVPFRLPSLARVLKAPLIAPEPPFAPQRPRILEAHGDRRVDHYYWLREKDNPEEIRYLEDENCYSSAVMAPPLPLQERLYHEIEGRSEETDTSAPTLYKLW